MFLSKLDDVSAWFENFVASFSAETSEEQRNYDLKIEHTAKVRSNIERLSASLNFTRVQQAQASIIAICHDVGRFPQYQQFATFNDATSVNHAALSVQTVSTQGVLDSFDKDSRSLVLQSVALHNVFILPDDLDPTSRLFAMLIRDADKLDIWRVLIEYCIAGPADRASAVVWELPDTGYCSEPAINEVINGRMINRGLLSTADDFKLLQLSWVYDLNFSDSFAMVEERGYIETLVDLLPEQTKCDQAVTAVRRHIANRQKVGGYGARI